MWPRLPHCLTASCRPMSHRVFAVHQVAPHLRTTRPDPTRPLGNKRNHSSHLHARIPHLWLNPSGAQVAHAASSLAHGCTLALSNTHTSVQSPTSESELRTRSQFVGAAGGKAVRGLPGGSLTRSEGGSFEQGELGRGRMLRRRGGGDGSREPSTVEREEGLPDAYMEEMQEFLWKDLVHLFDEQGIDKSMYDQKVEFRDPITKYDTLNGYLINIAVLRTVFKPIFELHSVKQTGPYEITTRWTMTMNFWIVAWQPKLLFTGVSIMRVNPETRKFCAHIDRWDSIQNNDYFSFEGAKDVIRQMQYFKQPDLETPKYKVWKRTAGYEVREYEPFVVVETDCDSMAASRGFNTVAGYIFGKNDKGETMKMTTPVYTETSSEPSASGAKIQIVLPSSCKLSQLPAPEVEGVNIQQVGKRVAAAIRFNGRPTLELVEEKRKTLEQALEKDGLKMKGTFGLARYNDPGQTWPIFMKNEVLAWLEDFQLD